MVQEIEVGRGDTDQLSSGLSDLTMRAWQVEERGGGGGGLHYFIFEHLLPSPLRTESH